MFEEYLLELLDRFSTPAGTVIQLIGFAGMICSFLTYIPRRRRTILAVRVTSNALWVLNYLFLGISGSIGAFAGVVTNGVETVRGVVFGKKDAVRKKLRRRAFLCPAAFIGTSVVAIFVLTVLLTEGDADVLRRELLVALLPMAATTCSTVAMWADDPLRLRLLMLPCILCWLTQSLIIRNPAGLISSAGELVSDAVCMVRECFRRHRSSAR